jgi:septal ring factor EnvC (AmiA/AmiB activator)
VRRLLSIVALAALAGAGGARAQGSAEIIRERELELSALREQIGQLSAQLDDLALRAHGIQGALEKVTVERRLQERRVAEALAESRLAEERVRAAAERLAEHEERLVAERRSLERRLAGLYRIGRHGATRLAFSLDPRGDPLPAIRLLRFLARRDAATVSRVEALRAGIERERRELELRHAEAASWHTQQASRRDELVRLERRQAALLAGTRRETSRLAEQTLRLADRETQLAALLDALYGRVKTPLAGRPIQEFRGLLDWPVRGTIVLGFGPRLDPRYRTRVPHNGIALETAVGAQVAAVYPGRVIFAAEVEGFGPTVVVQHAGKALTLYAGLSALSVRRDDLVSLRQPLGPAGRSLYFEIRVENRPEDPRRWIR